MGRDSPQSWHRLALGVALLVVFAGCSSVLPGLGGESAAYTTSGEDLNGTTLSQDHVSGLDSAESFTSRTVLDVSATNGSARIESTVMVDLAEERALQNSVISADIVGGGQLRTATLTTPDETYRRIEFGSDGQTTVQYQHATAPYQETGMLGAQPVNVTQAKNAKLAKRLGDAIDWTQTGTVERNGTTLTRYEARGAENFTEFRNRTDLGPTGANLSNVDANVSEISAVLFVDRTGLIYEFRFELTGTAQGQDVTLSFAVTTTNVGTTNVEDPDWLDEARQET